VRRAKVKADKAVASLQQFREINSKHAHSLGYFITVLAFIRKIINDVKYESRACAASDPFKTLVA
jgi:hypothetical protein